MWIRICPAYTCSSSCCDNSTVITEETQSQYFFRLGPMRSFSDGWFCQNPNGQTRHWNSWWGPAPGIYLFPQVTYLFGDGGVVVVMFPKVPLCLSGCCLYVGKRVTNLWWSQPQALLESFPQSDPEEGGVNTPWVGPSSDQGRCLSGLHFQGLGFLRTFSFMDRHLRPSCTRLGGRPPPWCEGGGGIIS